MSNRDINELAEEVTQLILEKLNINYIKAEEVNFEAPLFGDGNQLELDSIDGIEIVVALQQAYGVRITDQMPTKEILASIQSIVNFLVKENATEKIS